MNNLKKQKFSQKLFQNNKKIIKRSHSIPSSFELSGVSNNTTTDFSPEKLKRDGIGLIHKVYLILLKQKRLHLASTKTKSEVRGGGRKPWKQKGTGNARAGSSRSPLWVGGGVSFGPKPHTVSKKVNKKEKKKALSLLQQYKSNCFQTFSSTIFEIPTSKKTKYIVSFLKKIKIDSLKHEKVLFLFDEIEKEKMLEFQLASRNIKNVFVNSKKNLSFIQLLKMNKIVEFIPSVINDSSSVLT